MIYTNKTLQTNSLDVKIQNIYLFSHVSVSRENGLVLQSIVLRVTITLKYYDEERDFLKLGSVKNE